MNRGARRPDGPGGEGGFTLLELLVAITLLGLLMAGVLGGVRLGARAWETGSARLEDGARLLAVQQFLRARLQGAVPVYLDDASGETRLAFAGLADEVTFVGTLPGPLVPGLQRFTLGLRENRASVRHLAIAWQPLPRRDEDLPVTSDPAGRRDLLRDVESLSLTYFGSADGRAEPDWLEAWPDADVLPTLIRLRVELPEGDRRRVPDLIVRPMVDQPPFADF